jgi:hypothetical protein
MTLTAGDVALIDVPKLCAYLQSPAGWPATVAGALSASEKSAIGAAAGGVQTALNARPLVRGVFESAGAPAATLGFGGISLFYSAHQYGTQAPAFDPYLLRHADFFYYMTLRFAVSSAYLATNGNQRSWGTYAFE